MSRAAAISALEHWCQTHLPVDYRHFLDQYEEQVIGKGILVYSAESIIERNETFETASYCPGYLLIGDDSGGRGLLIKLENSEAPVFVSDLGDLNSDDFILIAESFVDWISKLS